MLQGKKKSVENYQEQNKYILLKLTDFKDKTCYNGQLGRSSKSSTRGKTSGRPYCSLQQYLTEKMSTDFMKTVGQCVTQSSHLIKWPFLFKGNRIHLWHSSVERIFIGSMYLYCPRYWNTSSVDRRSLFLWILHCGKERNKLIHKNQQEKHQSSPRQKTKTSDWVGYFKLASL